MKIEIMFWLIFAHFIGDWALQSEWMATNKYKYWFVMLAHCIIWTGCVCLALECLGMLSTWKICFLYVGHCVCDYWKCWVYSKAPFCKQKTYIHLYADQLFHVGQCLFVML